MDLNRAVGENIKRIRKGKKLSMERLAEQAGVSRSMLGQIERGEANPSVAILGKLASALKVPAEVLLENDDFQSLAMFHEEKQERVAGGKVVLRQNYPYDDVTRLESSFIELYIGVTYEPEISVPGCICHLTVMSGYPEIVAEGESFRLAERDTLRFAADRPWKIVNMTNSTTRLMLVYQYLK